MSIKRKKSHKVQKVQRHILRFQGQNHQTVFLLMGDKHKKVQETRTKSKDKNYNISGGNRQHYGCN